MLKLLRFPFDFYLWVTVFLGRWRGVFLPVGIAALVAMGVHAASEIVAEWVFYGLGLLDLVAETVVEWGLSLVASTGWTSPGFVRRNAYAFASLFDIEMRESWARWGGLAVELYVDTYLVWAALAFVEARPRSGPELSLPAWKAWLRQQGLNVRYYFGDLTVEKVYLPVGALCAVLSGTGALGLAVENSLSWASGTLIAGFELLLAVRFGWPMVVHAVDLAESRNEFARLDGVPTRRRQLRGLVSASIVLPVLLAAALMRAPRLFG